MQMHVLLFGKINNELQNNFSSSQTRKEITEALIRIFFGTAECHF